MPLWHRRSGGEHTGETPVPQVLHTGETPVPQVLYTFVMPVPQVFGDAPRAAG